nr:LamG domain-containing protein [Clostridium sp. CCUG 7971]
MFKYKITNNDAVLSDNGKFGKCFNFSGGHFKLEPIDIGTFKNGVTIDFWCYRERLNTDYFNYILGSGIGYLTIGFNNSVNNGTFMFNIFGDGSSFDYIMPTGRFIHIAIVCVNNKAYLYENGVLIKTKDYIINKTTAPLTTFGQGSNSNSAPYCRIDELRISNVARWTENFTPPTAPYTYETIDKIPTETDLVESVNSMDKVYENIDFQRFLLGNKLKRIGVDTLPSDKMSSLIGKVGEIQLGKKWASGISGSGFESGRHFIEVSGLNFKPSVVVIFPREAKKDSVYILIVL